MRGLVEVVTPPLMQRISKPGAALAAGTFVAAVALGAASLPFVASFDDACTLHLDPSLASPIRPPSRWFLLGTDALGRSEALRLAFATRASLGLTLPAAVVSCLAGLMLGAAAGVASAPRVNVPIVRVFGACANFAFDVALAVPFIVIVACAAALLEDPTPQTVGAIMVLASAPSVAKVARDRVLVTSRDDYVLAAAALGAGLLAIAMRHQVPRAARAVVALAPSVFAQLLLTEAALGFLGLGLRPPVASLGTLMADAQDFVADAPWLLALPVAVLAALVVAASAIADVLDTREGIGA